jgi:hypothetical protein
MRWEFFPFSFPHLDKILPLLHCHIYTVENVLARKFHSNRYKYSRQEEVEVVSEEEILWLGKIAVEVVEKVL